jgi:hypothetical protein
MTTKNILEEAMYAVFCDIRNLKMSDSTDDERQELLDEFKFILTCMLAENHSIEGIGKMFLKFDEKLEGKCQ